MINNFNYLSFIKPDTRPLFVLADVEGIRLNDITVEGKDVTSDWR